MNSSVSAPPDVDIELTSDGTTRVTEILEQDNHFSADVTGLKDLLEQLQRKKDILITLDGSVVGTHRRRG